MTTMHAAPIQTSTRPRRLTTDHLVALGIGWACSVVAVAAVVAAVVGLLAFGAGRADGMHDQRVADQRAICADPAEAWLNPAC